MAASLGELMVGLGVDFSGMNMGATEIESRLEQMGTRLFFVGSRIGAAFSAPLAGAMQAIGDFGMAFETAMTNSLSAIDNVTPQIRGQLEAQATMLSTTTKFSAVEAAQAYRDLGRAGYDAAGMMGALPLVAQFAGANLGTMKDASKDLVLAQIALGLQSKDTGTNLENLTRIGDVLTTVTKNVAGSTANEFAAALERAGGTIREYNIPLEQATAILGAYAEQNIVGASAGQSFRMLITNLTGAVTQHAAAWKTANLSITDANGNLKPLGDVIDILTQKLGPLSDEGKRAELQFLGLGTRGQNAILPLLGMGDSVKELTTKLEQSGGTMKQVAEKNMDTLAVKLDEAKNRFDAVKNAIYEGFKPAFEEQIIPLINQGIDRFQALGKAMVDMTTEHKKFLIVGVEFAKYMGEALTLFGGLALAISVFRGLFTVFAAGWATISGALGTVVSWAIDLLPALAALGPEILQVGALWAGWKVGEWIGTWTQMTDWVQDQTVKLMVYTGEITKAGAQADIFYRQAHRFGTPNAPASPKSWQLTPQQTLQMPSEEIAGPGLTGGGTADHVPSKSMKEWSKTILDLQSILKSTDWDGSVESMVKLGAATKDVEVYFGMTSAELKLYMETVKAAQKESDTWNKTLTSLSSILESDDWDGTVESMIKLGASTKNTAAYFGMTSAEIKLYMEGVKATNKESVAWSTTLDHLSSILESDDWDGTVDGMVKLGASTKDTGTYFGMTSAEVKLYMEGVKEANIETKAWNKVTTDLQSILTSDAWDGTVEGMLKLGATVQDTAKYFGMSDAEVKLYMATTREFTKELNTITNQFGAMASEFGRLSRDVGGSLGAVFTAISQVGTEMVAAGKGGHELKTGFDDMDGPNKNVAAGLVNIAQGAMQVAGAFMAATNNASMAANVMGGVMVGAQAGAQFGPIGAAIGAAIGGIAALIKGRPEWADVGDTVGNVIGVHISQKLSQAIVDLANTSFHGNDYAAMVASLDKIIGEAGGMDKLNVTQFEGAFRDTFVMLTTGAMTAAQATKVLDTNFANFAKNGTDALGFLDSKLTEIIQLDKQLGTNSTEIAKYMSGQTQSVAAGFNEIAAGVINDQTQVDRLGRLAGVAFGAALAGGSSFIDAIKSISAGLDSVSGAVSTFKLNQTSAFGELSGINAFIKANGALVTELDGVNKMVVGLANAGLLTQKSISDLGAEAVDTFKRMVTAGLDTNAAMLMMQPTLQTLWEAEQKYNLKVDDATQALLDQAVANNTVGEEHKSVNDQMLDGIKQLNKTMTDFVNLLTGNVTGAFEDLSQTTGTIFDGIKDKIKSLEQPITIPVTVDQRPWNEQYPGSNDYPYMAEGGIAMGQRTVNVGDAGPEAIIPLTKLQDMLGKGASADGSGGSLTVQLALDGRVVTQTVLKNMPAELRRNGIFT